MNQSPLLPPRSWSFIGFAVGFLLSAFSASANPTASSVWLDFAANPHNHQNIPNNAYAGYRGGKMPIPDVPVVVNLLDFGGNGNGLADNTQAFQNAIEAAWIAGGGAVYVPPGVYVVDKMIHLNQSGVVLRGAGRDQTTILLHNNMDHAVGPMQTGDGGTHWFWQGGMIWMGPAAQLRRNFVRDPIHQGVDMGVDTGSWWPDQPSNHGLVGKRVANVTGEYAEGSFTVTVDDASELQEGAYFRMVYRNKANIGDYDLYREMVGHPLMQNNFPWANATALNNFTQWVWPVRIAMIEGNQITLDQPLRIRTRAKFEVGFETMGLIVEESGIEDLRIELTSAPNRWDSHSHETRHNAIYLTKTINCWVRNVDVVNADNGIITRASKNIELRNFRILGDIRLHHGVTVVRGHDNLVTDFVIEPRVSHGISIEDLASGNVFSKGDMGFGTESGGGSFDSHRYLSFDILRTDIYVLNSIGRPGGNANTGPLNGRRVVHWNIRGNTGTNNGDYVNMPDAHSHGALVGVQGIRSNDAAWGMVPGDKGNIIADEGIVPIYPDLHLKQRELRMQMEAFVELQTPHLDLIPPGPTTLSAFANGGPGTIQSVVFKVDGSVINTATTVPYEASWNPQPGTYEVELVMQTTSGTYRSPRRTIQVGQREIIQDNDARMVYTGPRTVVSDSAALGGTYTTFRGDQNAHVTFSFRGTRFMIYIHNLQPTQQRMNIFINDMSNPAQFINVRRFTEPRYMVYDSGPLPEGDYTVMIQPPSHQVMLDYVVIENTGEFGGGQLPNIPVAPSALQVSGTTDSQVSLAWTDNSTNETGFKIERSPNGSNSWSQIATVAANTTTYTDSGLAASTTYFYRVRAYNGDGDSPYTNVVSATTQSDADPVAPSAPQALLAQAMSSSRIDVTWTASSGSPDGYRIERSPNGTANWIEVGSVTADTTLFSSTELQPATTYFYRVRAYNQAGDSPYSSTANATTYAVGAEPQFVFLDNFADNDRTVNPAWFVVDNPANVEVSQSGGVLSLGRLAPNSHTYLASHWSGTTLAVGDELVMSFRVRMTGNPGNRNNEIVFAVGNNNGTTVAVDGDSASYVDDFGYFAALGFGTGVSSIYRDVGGNHLLGRPGTADQTILASSGAGELSLSNEFKDYTLTLERTASGLEITLSDGVNSLTITDTSVPNSSFHTFNTVTFGYYNRNTAHSLDVDDLRVLHVDPNAGPEAPSAPQGLMASVASTSQIDLSWSVAAGEPEGYRVERSPNGQDDWSQIYEGSAAVTEFSDTELFSDTTYHYRVLAFNEGGESAPSSVVSATTMAESSAPVAVFFDDFADNDRTVNPAWFVVGDAAAVVIGETDTVLSLGRSMPNSHTYLAAHWSGTTLAVGDELVMSFRARMTGNPGNRNNEIVFAVGNNNGTTVAVDGDSASYVDDFGYFAALGFGTGVTSIYRDVGGNHLLGRPGTADQTILASSGAGELSLSNEFKDYTLTLERTASGLEITLSDGVNSLTIADTSVPNSSFHTFNTVTFGYYNRNTAHSLDVDDLRVWHGGANTGYPDPNPDPDPDPDPDPAGSPYLLSMSTYLGDDSDNDEVVALRILSDGTIAVAANIGAAQPGNPGQPPLSPVLLLGASQQTSGVILLLSRDGRTIQSITRLADSLRDLDIDAEDNLYVAAGSDGLMKLNPDASQILWHHLSGTVVHRVAATPNGTVGALSPSNLASLNTAPGAGVVYLYDNTGSLVTQYNGMQNTLDIAVDELTSSIITIGWRNANTWEDGGNIFPVQIAYMRAHDFSGNIKWTNYSFDASSDIDGGHTFDENGFVIVTNPHYINSTGHPVGVDSQGRTTYGFVNNMADTRGYRVRIGHDGYLYAAFEAAGGNHIFRYDGRHIDLNHPDYRKPIDSVGGTFFNQFINTGSSHKTFVGKYIAGTGQRVLGNQYNTLITNNGMSANALRCQQSGLAVDAQGRMFFGGAAASGLPLPGNEYFTPDAGEVSINPFVPSTESGAFLWGVGADLSTRTVVARLASGWTHTVDARILAGESEPIVAWGGRSNLNRPMHVRNAWQTQPGYGAQDGFIAVLGGAPSAGDERKLLQYGGSYTASNTTLRGEQPARYAADLSGNGLNDDWVIEYAWNPDIPLSPPSPNYSGPVFRGGFRAQILQETNRNFNTNAFGNSTTSIRVTPPAGKVSRVSGVFFFDKADMEGISPEDTLSFDAGSYLKVTSSEPGLFGSRWLVRDGAQYYVSEEVIDDSGRLHITNIPASMDHGRWAVYAVDHTMHFDPDSAVFEIRIFSDITAVGFIVNKEQYDNSSIWIRWNGFEAGMTVNGVPNQSPIAVLQSDYAGASVPPLTVNVDGSGSYDPDGDIVFMNWEPGGNAPSVGGETASLQYLAAGSYQLTLSVWDERLEADTDSIWIDVVSPAAENPSLIVASWGGDVVDSHVNFRNFNGSQWTVAGEDYDFMNGYAFSTTSPLTPAAVRGSRLFGGMLAKSQNSAAGFNDRRFENANPWDGINIRHTPTSARPAQWHGAFFIDKSDFQGEGREEVFTFQGGARMVIEGIYAFTRVGDVRFLVRDGSSWYVSQKVLTQNDSSLEIPSDANHGMWAPYDPSADHMNFDQTGAVFANRTFTNLTAVGFIIDRDSFETAVSHFAFRHFYVENGGEPTILPPPVPQNVSAVAVGSNRIDVSWDGIAGNLDGYSVERSLTGSGDWMEVAVIDPEETFFLDLGLDANVTYFYRVLAFNQAGSSPFSSIVSATTSSSSATLTVFADDFSDNDRTVNPAWYVIDNPANAVIQQSQGVLALGRSVSGSHTYLAAHWAGTTLAVGDLLEFSFRARGNGDANNRSHEVAFGIGNNNGTVATSDGDTASYVDDFGYIAAIGLGTGLSSIYRDAGIVGFLGRMVAADHTQLVSSPAGALSLNATDFKDYMLTLARTEAGLEITLTDGNHSITVLDTNVPHAEFYTFNTLTFGYYNRNTEHFLEVDSMEVIHRAGYLLNSNDSDAGFDAWIAQHGLAAEANKLWSDSPARDGVPNLLKYAFGLNPLLQSGSAGSPIQWMEQRDDNAGLHMRYRRQRHGTEFNAHEYHVADLVYVVEVSADLQNWYRQDVHGNPLVVTVGDPVVDSEDPQVESVTVRLLVPVEAAQPSLFMRLSVSRIDPAE